MDHIEVTTENAGPGTKGRIVGQKAPLKLKRIWAIRFGCRSLSAAAI